MTVTSNSDMPTTTPANNNGALRPITKRIRALRKKHKHILRLEESISQGNSLNKEQQEVLSSKHSVITQAELFEKLLEEISSDLQCCKGQTSSNAILSTADAAIEGNRGRGVATIDSFQVPLHEAKESVDEFKAVKCQEMSSKNDSETKEILNMVEPLEKERYLCIWDGFVMHHLDLKESKGQSNCNCYELMMYHPFLRSLFSSWRKKAFQS